MYWRAVIISMLLVSAGAATTAHAVEVTTYGAGLKSCRTYLDAREQQNADEIAFVDWASGYLSGVNATSHRTNRILGDSNLQSAIYWIGNYCRARPGAPFAVAVGSLLTGASPGPATQGTEITTYGAGFKSCGAYLNARERQGADEGTFLDWLSGYVSGVNAISMRTNNILGHSDIAGVVYWLDDYCRAHELTRFAVAVDARIAANHADEQASIR
jgi:hypothetical protein